MRARLARPRKSLRGRLVVPVAAAAAVALVGGVVVASPDTPTVRGDVQTVALTAPSIDAGASYSFDLGGLVAQGQWAGIVIDDVTGLPEGLTYDGEGTISGTTVASGVYQIQVHGTVNGETVTVPVTLVVNNADGSAPAGAEGGSTAAVQGSLGGEAQAGGQITTGSDGADAILGVVAGIVTSLTGDSGSAAELVTGSTGGGETSPEAPGGPLGSLANGEGELNLGSLGMTEGSPEIPGSSGGIEGEAGGGIDGEVTTGFETPSFETGSAGNGETTGGGEIVVPGSTAEAGSLGDVAPGLALSGAALLGLAGISLLLGGGSSGGVVSLPALPGSSGGSSGSVAPTVAAGSPAPSTVEAPGPTVANGRG